MGLRWEVGGGEKDGVDGSAKGCAHSALGTALWVPQVLNQLASRLSRAS